ncbi:MAG: hypothetical protein ACD_71C00209G0002 [uncultured bacterium (gcode 4)]|uniref:Lipoprotein n=1 Tax=uncultured bacterium (gcode 4) TaxID=1234023 RepID=K1YMP0_9BACT|nr:MAG: hypothetical protein ACD_71C00209G0002 [uncultured bacterium (gcode 4)]
MRKIITLFIFISSVFFLSGCTFVWDGYISSYDPPWFLMGIWHGLIAPYTLIVRWFIDIHMYAMPNSGWLYDAGFLIGLLGSIPIGWAATIISVITFIF